MLLCAESLTPDGGDALGGGRYWQRKTLVDVRSDKTFKRTVMEGSFGTWVKQATATPPAEYDLPLAAGLVPNRASRYYMCQDSCATLYFCIQKSGQTNDITTMQIATLPSGFRPQDEVRVACTAQKSDGTFRSGLCYLASDGNLTVILGENAMTVQGQIQFIAS